MKKQTLCLLLALLLASMTACASETTDTPAADPEETVTQAAETEDPFPYTSHLPDADYEGFLFRVMGEEMRDHYESEEQTGEVINDAVYQRNIAVEEKYNIALEYEILTWGSGDDQIQTSVMAGDNPYSLVTCTHLYLGKNLTSGHFVNWNNIPQVDMSRPYYIADANNTYSLGDKTMLLFGDYMDSNINCCWVFVSNLNLLDKYGITGLYDVVDAGDWTIDYFLSLVSDIYEDTDGNGTRDVTDTYGFVTDTYAAVDSLGRSFHMSAISKDDKNYPVLDFYNETTVDAYTKIYKMYYETTGVYAIPAAFTQLEQAFIPGTAVFSNQLMVTLYGEKMRDMEDDYGILPTPKYQAEDPGYSTHLDGTFSAQMIMVSQPESEFERTGTITEALNAYSRQIVVPAIYDTALKVKVTRDEGSTRMIDYALEGRKFSFDSFDESSFKLSPVNVLRSNIQGKKDSITSYYESNKSSCEKWIEDMVKAFEESQ